MITTKILSHDNRSPGRDVNTAPPKYEAGAQIILCDVRSFQVTQPSQSINQSVNETVSLLLHLHARCSAASRPVRTAHKTVFNCFVHSLVINVTFMRPTSRRSGQLCRFILGRSWIQTSSVLSKGSISLCRRVP
jgi:hypothetical protein